MLFDSHIHLDFFLTEDLDASAAPERQGVLREAVASGISAFFVPGTRVAKWTQLELLGRQSHFGGAQIYFGIGQHPYWSSEVTDFDAFASAALMAVKEGGAVAIGECGLDKKRGGDMEHQVALFETQLKLAKEIQLPCVIHCVGAQAELFQSVDRVGLGSAGGVVHGFSGDRSFAQALVRRGFLLGVGPAITRTSRQRLRDAVCDISQDFYVLETDAPDQRVDPATLRGSPLDLIRVAQELAQLRNQPFEQIAEQSTHNARRLFGLKSD